jgi:hypothetical protein
VKKEVSRERELPAFSLSISELEALWSRLTKLFNDSAHLYTTVEIELPLQKLKFENLEELKEYKHLPSRVTNFDIWLSQEERRITIGSHQRRWGSRATVRATAEAEAWCAGAIETVFSFVQSYKLWYGWFLSKPVFLALNLMAVAPAVAMMATGGHLERVHPFLNEHLAVVTIGWPGAVYSLVLLWLANNRLLPSAVIRMSDSEGFFRKHATELQTASFLIAAVVAILTFIWGLVPK